MSGAAHLRGYRLDGGLWPYTQALSLVSVLIAWLAMGRGWMLPGAGIGSW